MASPGPPPCWLSRHARPRSKVGAAAYVFGLGHCSARSQAGGGRRAWETSASERSQVVCALQTLRTTIAADPPAQPMRPPALDQPDVAVVAFIAAGCVSAFVAVGDDAVGSITIAIVVGLDVGHDAAMPLTILM